MNRVFTQGELADLDVPFYNVRLNVVVEVDDNRKLTKHIFEHEGVCWRVYYRSHMDEGIWWDDDEVEATAVEQRRVSVVKWVPVIDKEDA